MTNIPWLCKVLTLGETRWRVHRNSLYCLWSCSLNPKLFKNKILFKNKWMLCMYNDLEQFQDILLSARKTPQQFADQYVQYAPIYIKICMYKLFILHWVSWKVCPKTWWYWLPWGFPGRGVARRFTWISCTLLHHLNFGTCACISYWKNKLMMCI